jgi:hypothetical protein
VPNTVISDVLDELDLDLSFNWNKTESRFLLHVNDTVPENINMDDIGYVGGLWDNGVGKTGGLSHESGTDYTQRTHLDQPISQWEMMA